MPLLVSVNFDPPRVGGFFGSDEEQERRRIRDAESNPAELARGGRDVRPRLGVGARTSWPGIRNAIEKGLPREAALRAVTLGAAEVLGVADTTGSLEAGKIANVVAWSGEPLAKDAKAR